MSNSRVELLTKAGDIHKKVQEYTKTLLQPEINLFYLATTIENKIKSLLQKEKQESNSDWTKFGVAFPTGLSINNCAAHFTPNPNDTYQVLHSNDLIKVDFGVHINGHVIDGAFSWSASEKYDELIAVSIEATNCGINNAGPDAILGEIGGQIQEIIESYEIEIDGKLYKVKSTVDICGHQIGQYHIHSGKAVPNINFPYFERMKVDEEYAIETFPTTGSGKVVPSLSFDECSHFMITNPITQKNKKSLSKNLIDEYDKLYKEFSTLAFCKRWTPKSTNLKQLTDKKIIQTYPPLYDIKGSFVSQTENSILITEHGKIILN